MQKFEKFPLCSLDLIFAAPDARAANFGLQFDGKIEPENLELALHRFAKNSHLPVFFDGEARIVADHDIAR